MAIPFVYNLQDLYPETPVADRMRAIIHAASH